MSAAENGVPGWLTEVMTKVSSAPASWFSSYVPPPGGGRRQSAVLILFGSGPDGSTDVVLTQRASTMRNHPGQVSFPGGGAESGDVNARQTALREANEEIGLDPESVQILGSCQPCTSRSAGMTSRRLSDGGTGHTWSRRDSPKRLSGWRECA
ncbi:CoA pyrophosphatase [Ornithinimicrobium sp. INDO-MA30-4]|uniref:NUDIX hydrolase n=1 Tax=Ornithinimicrobium sp. INDO-MA30-4 TaxID=2908651 RepID=UPI001F362CA9|nr:CoA pyrophosphatase [Ornithinimicrobium sp. INDO-MA30-4]UJH70467.1 CoA pyrophosphatase [Ornithinimicrobium sp. INDO-MA30-4]